uniref:Uncharacterized protein n=1 Tax=Prevotella sp. GTC17254 TaxID=3236794 RepID=A0AB33IWC5_9BACT
MLKVEITEWGELAIVEKLLSDYAQHTSARKDPRVIHARNLLERVRPALIEATGQL